ncbi:WD40 repeat-like protein [Backusella circina FSU 941]|nr:WD40 repeat-like protein [Backusella circina FSU 941]
MPLLALNRACRQISNLFYPLGAQCASHSALLLITLTTIVVFWCYPVVSDYYYHRVSPTTALDGQFWQFSPHIYKTNNITDTLSCDIIFHQIRISADNITLLYQDSLQIYNSLKTDHRLSSICMKNSHGCIIHSPFEYWIDLDHFEKDTDKLKTVNNQLHAISPSTQLSMYPMSTMANAHFDDNGKIISADSVLITVLLQDKEETKGIWQLVWDKTVQKSNIFLLESDAPNSMGWYTQAQEKSIVLEYKFDIRLPSTFVQVVCFCYVCLFLVLVNHFDRPQIKSKTGLAFTSVFLSATCFIMTCGVYYYFSWNFPAKPAWLSILVAVSSTLQHVFLLTRSVLSVGKDIDIRERMGRGLESVGIVVIATWFGETVILLIGSATDHARSFCFFSGIALTISYLFCFPFFTVALSIDIHRIELIDLSEEDLLQNRHNNNGMRLINGTAEKTRLKSPRAIHSLLLCLSILYLVSTKPNVEPIQNEINTSWIKMSRQFWKTVNPTLENKWLKVDPVQYVLLYHDAKAARQQAEQLDSYYKHMSTAINNIFHPLPKEHLLQKAVKLFLYLNVPGLLVALILILLLLWMLPPLRENWLLPFLRSLFVRTVTIIVRGLVATVGKVPFVRKLVTDLNEYTEDGTHIGAISIQSRYNRSQIDANVQNVNIKTLIGQHTADLKAIFANPNLLLSIGQDGRGVLWNSRKGEWLMRLDRLKKANSLGWQAEQRKIGFAKIEKNPGTKHLVPTTCGEIDRQKKCIALGYEDGAIRLWDANTALLISELTSGQINDQEEKEETLRQRGQRKNNSRFACTTTTKVVHVAFLESSTEKHLVSLHKDGKLYEWNVIDGKAIQCFPSGHTREITMLQVLENNSYSFFYVITASKDGKMICWKCSLNEKMTIWNRLYSIDVHCPITSIASQQLQNGIGIIVTGSEDGAVKVWDLDKGNLLCTLSKSDHPSLLQGDDLVISHVNLNKHSTSRDLDVCDHRGAVYHVAVTCIKNNEFKDSKCPICNTPLNSGFFVASVGQDNVVNTWRVLYRKGIDTPGCTSCAKDYHRHQFKRRGWKLNSSNDSDVPSSPSWTNTRSSRKKAPKQCEEEWDSLFLGKIPQLAGRGILFCDNMILSGVRRNAIHHHWEAWFSSLQYYEPSTLENESQVIPTVAYPLEEDLEQEDPVKQDIKFWDGLLLHLFGIKKVRSNKKRRLESIRFDEEEVEDDDAYEMLPFSYIQFVVPTSGYGFACDYGNFIKIISFNPIKSADLNIPYD